MAGHPGAYSYVREDWPGIFNTASGQKIDFYLAEPILDIGESFTPRTQLPIPQLP